MLHRDDPQEIQRQKLAQREQLKMEDIRVMEYIKEKQQREEEQQAELEAAKAEKEKEIARLRAQQERAKDKQAEKVCVCAMCPFYMSVCFRKLHVSSGHPWADQHWLKSSGVH